MKPINIKSIIGYLMVGLVFMGSYACTDQFEEINDNPLAATQLDAKYQFGWSQLRYAGNGHEEWRGNLIYTSPLAGMTNSLYGGGQEFVNSDDWTRAKWEAEFEGDVKNLEDILARLSKENEEGDNDNLIAASRVMRVLAYQRLTDLYGDIPYSEAGQGYNDLIYLPKYDTQESIYTDLIKECTEAAAQFDENQKTFEQYDIFYGGDVAKWKKLANSVKLRLGMRLTKVDAALAQQTVSEAINGGVMTTPEDRAIVTHTTDGGPWGMHENGTGSALNGKVGGFAHSYLSEHFLEALKESRDPRIFQIAAVIYPSESDYKPYTFEELDPFKPMAKLGEAWQDSILIGGKLGDQWASGFMGLYAIQKADGTTEVVDANYTSSRNPVTDESLYNVICGINTETVGSRVAPTIVMDYAEVEFLLAEAAVRGWGASNAQEHYENGIRAAINRYPDLYPGQDYVNNWMNEEGFDYAQGIEDYITNANITWDSNKALELIATEKWKSFFLNGYEAFAEWRRTGFPTTITESITEFIDINLYDENDLTNVIGTYQLRYHSGGETNYVRPRRLPYPAREATVNKTNFDEVVDRQGNDLSDRVWWDK